LSTALFGKNVEPACRHCESEIQVMPSNGQVLCSRLGVVAADYHCKRYVYDPLKRIPKRKRPLPKFTPADFSIE
jgi:hypothetical protein